MSGRVGSGNARLRDLGLRDLSVDGCEVFPVWKAKFIDLIVKNENMFS